jgi:hypothetical protein
MDKDATAVCRERAAALLLALDGAAAIVEDYRAAEGVSQVKLSVLAGCNDAAVRDLVTGQGMTVATVRKILEYIKG